ncbi:MAG: phosphomannose isomerase type II C-terminal cupin domain [Negativicutes bacterium]|nr:phosphomannose isomerase type II C-terminal cupin domain [Negativicutes bacterium]
MEDMKPDQQKFSGEERPWGSYEILLEESTYKVKRITVKSGGELSLQSHRLRSEHWTMVVGEGQVTLDEKTVTLKAGEHIYIPTGGKHRLANLGKESLILIEVQCGDYLGEDDIIRYEDRYGRT